MSFHLLLINWLNNSFVSNIYVGNDGKLHKVQGGAHSVLPFKSGYDSLETPITNGGKSGTYTATKKYNAVLLSMTHYSTNTNQFTISINGVDKTADSIKNNYVLLLPYNGKSGDVISFTRTDGYGNMTLSLLE